MATVTTEGGATDDDIESLGRAWSRTRPVDKARSTTKAAFNAQGNFAMVEKSSRVALEAMSQGGFEVNSFKANPNASSNEVMGNNTVGDSIAPGNNVMAEMGMGDQAMDNIVAGNNVVANDATGNNASGKEVTGMGNAMGNSVMVNEFMGNNAFADKVTDNGHSITPTTPAAEGDGGRAAQGDPITSITPAAEGDSKTPVKQPAEGDSIAPIAPAAQGDRITPAAEGDSILPAPQGDASLPAAWKRNLPAPTFTPARRISALRPAAGLADELYSIEVPAFTDKLSLGIWRKTPAPTRAPSAAPPDSVASEGDEPCLGLRVSSRAPSSASGFLGQNQTESESEPFPELLAAGDDSFGLLLPCNLSRSQGAERCDTRAAHRVSRQLEHLVATGDSLLRAGAAGQMANHLRVHVRQVDASAQCRRQRTAEQYGGRDLTSLQQQRHMTITASMLDGTVQEVPVKTPDLAAPALAARQQLARLQEMATVKGSARSEGAFAMFRQQREKLRDRMRVDRTTAQAIMTLQVEDCQEQL